MNSLKNKKCILILICLLFLVDITHLLNTPFLRPTLGFIFLTILPGLLILQILKLDKIGSTEKFVLSVGLSISFLMLFGLLINNLSLGVGYKTPLTTTFLLISFNIAAIALILVAYRTMKNGAVFSLPDFNLTTSEKVFLIVPILFPALSIFGTHVMNTTDNNFILIFLLFLIPIYVAFICFFNHKIPARIYPIVIFLIGISLILIKALRSNHILGIDAHVEYYFFRTTFDNSYWSVFGHSTLDACLSISLLPTIYQLFLNVNTEIFFNVFYVLLFSLTPLIVFVISKKYVGDFYGFLASIFFISQARFIFATGGARTNVAIFFFALAMMILFSDKLDPLKKRILFIVFMVSCVVSHYSTTYIFFFIMLGAFVGTEIVSKKYAAKRVVSLTTVIIFFSMVFFWYSQVTETAFNAGVKFIDKTFSNLNMFFIEESRGENTMAMLGEGIQQKGIPHMIEFVWTWLTFALIAIGVITLIWKYKEMSFPERKFEKPDFLKEKFEVTYFVIALACVGLLVAMVALPHLSKGYALDRLYAVAITILSVFFVIGGIVLSKLFFFFTKRKPVLKEKQKSLTKRSLDQRNNGENNSQVGAYLIILLVLIPYFLSISGVTYQMFGYQRAIILNSVGEQDYLYISDQDIIAARWIGNHPIGSRKDLKIYSDVWCNRVFALAYEVNKCPRTSSSFFKNNKTVDDGYIYLRYANVVAEKVCPVRRGTVNITEYSHLFIGNNKIYANGGSEYYKCEGKNEIKETEDLLITP